MAREGILVLSSRLPRLSQHPRLMRAIYSTISHNGSLPEQKGDKTDDDSDRIIPIIKHNVCLPTVSVPKSLELAQEKLLSGTHKLIGLTIFCHYVK